jgi:hypothetical protein
MLLHPRVNFSTFPAELVHSRPLQACNGWLQCGSMRIELPTTSWVDPAQRAEDDAHTLTVAAQPATDWFTGAWTADLALALRTEVAASEPLVLTLTL